jgi:hypothetical protein
MDTAPCANKGMEGMWASEARYSTCKACLAALGLPPRQPAND